MPTDLLNIIKSCYDAHKYCVVGSKEHGVPFETSRGLLQGSCLSPLIFTVFASSVFEDAEEKMKLSNFDYGVRRISFQAGNRFDWPPKRVGGV
jgi:hypothetical protein